MKDKASDILEANLKNRFDGLNILNEVHEEIKIAINNANINDSKKLLALETIRSEIMAIQSQYKSGLGQRTPTQVIKKEIGPYLVLGLMTGLLVGFLYALTSLAINSSRIK